jgi:hypothetical protein
MHMLCLFTVGVLFFDFAYSDAFSMLMHHSAILRYFGNLCALCFALWRHALFLSSVTDFSILALLSFVFTGVAGVQASYWGRKTTVRYER